jgi:hypothetical protein
MVEMADMPQDILAALGDGWASLSSDNLQALEAALLVSHHELFNLYVSNTLPLGLEFLYH